MNGHDHDECLAALRDLGCPDADIGPLERAVRGDIDVIDMAGPIARSLGEAAFNLARKLDRDAGMATAAVARELRETLKTLAEAAGDDDGSALLDQLSAPVGHTAPAG